jgi:tetratricopeptide (TPR) repeat protein
LAYFNILQSTEYGEEDNSINLSRKAFSILNNSYSLLNLMHTYWMKGQYDKVHECADKCIALALDEGNTWNLASCYRLIGSVYACLNAEEIMIPFYNRAIHLLQNTYWNNQLDDIYYNIGATYISNKKFDLALGYLEMVKWEDNFLLSHKKALTLIRDGKKEDADKYINEMKSWILKNESEGNIEIEKMMLKEAEYECKKDFLKDPQYINLLETLMDSLKKERHKGFVIFYEDILKKAYCNQRKYKKALELYD